MKKLWLICTLVLGTCFAYETFNAAYKDGKAEFKNRNYQKAFEIQQEAVKLARQPYQIYEAKLAASDAASRLKNDAKVEEILKEITVQKDLKSHHYAMAHMRLGMLYARQKKTDQAISHFQKSIEADSSRWTFYTSSLTLSDLFSNKKDYVQADRYLQPLLERKETSLRYRILALQKMFTLNMKKGDLTAAAGTLSRYEQLLQDPKCTPKDRCVYFNQQGKLFYRQKQYQKAAQSFSRSVSEQGGDQWIRDNSQNLEAISYSLAGEYSKAMELIGKTRKPVKWMKKTIERNYLEYEVFAREKKAFQASLKSQKLAEAEQHLKECEKASRNPNAPRYLVPRVLDLRGTMLITQKKYSEAAEVFAQIQKIKESSKAQKNQAKANEALCCCRMGEHDKAMNLLKQCSNPPWMIRKEIEKKYNEAHQ